MRIVPLAFAAAIAVASCTAPATSVATATPMLAATPTDTPSPSPSESPTPTPQPARHVFVIVMENTSLAAALRAPSIAKLAATYALAANYHAVASPSLPNYLAMTSGSTYGIGDNGYYPLPPGGLGAQLTAAGVMWRAYMEGLTDAGGCLRSPYPYALKHNPFAYYGGACPENVVPLEALDADLAANTPRLAWITPGLCHDAHDCPIDEAGEWLAGLVAKIVASRAWQENGVLFVVWDEGSSGSDLAPLIVARPGLAGGRSEVAYDHYSLLATVEDIFGLPRLGAAKDADPLTDLVPRTGR